MPTTKLLASKLVTSAIRYAEGPVTLRLMQERALVCEVADLSSALPRLRHAAGDDECGHGLQIVSRLSHRWGARRTPTGNPLGHHHPSTPATLAALAAIIAGSETPDLAALLTSQVHLSDLSRQPGGEKSPRS